MLKLSVVIPVFNEDKVVTSSVPTIISNLSFLDDSEYEIIIVNDGSTDCTQEKLLNLKRDFPRVRLILMQDNHGHMRALESGMREARGEYVATMDCDLQDPPSVLNEMYKLIASSNVSCVQSVRADRSKDSYFKRNTAAIYYRIIRTLTGVSVIKNAGDFRILSRSASDFLCNLPEKKKIFRLLIPYFGFETIEYKIIREKRIAGNTKYSLRKMLSLALDSYLSFSIKPLKFISYLSILSLCFAVLGSIIVVTNFLSKKTVPGWTSLMLVSFFLFSIVLLSIATLGAYIGRIYNEILDRPSLMYREII